MRARDIHLAKTLLNKIGELTQNERELKRMVPGKASFFEVVVERNHDNIELRLPVDTIIKLVQDQIAEEKNKLKELGVELEDN